jgi:hypothetical protein
MSKRHTTKDERFFDRHSDVVDGDKQASLNLEQDDQCLLRLRQTAISTWTHSDLLDYFRVCGVELTSHLKNLLTRIKAAPAFAGSTFSSSRSARAMTDGLKEALPDCLREEAREFFGLVADLLNRDEPKGSRHRCLVFWLCPFLPFVRVFDFLLLCFSILALDFAGSATSTFSCSSSSASTTEASLIDENVQLKRCLDVASAKIASVCCFFCCCF